MFPITILILSQKNVFENNDEGLYKANWDQFLFSEDTTIIYKFWLRSGDKNTRHSIDVWIIGELYLVAKMLGSLSQGIARASYKRFVVSPSFSTSRVVGSYIRRLYDIMNQKLAPGLNERSEYSIQVSLEPICWKL